MQKESGQSDQTILRNHQKCVENTTKCHCLSFWRFLREEKSDWPDSFCILPGTFWHQFRVPTLHILVIFENCHDLLKNLRNYRPCFLSFCKHTCYMYEKLISRFDTKILNAFSFKHPLFYPDLYPIFLIFHLPRHDFDPKHGGEWGRCNNQGLMSYGHPNVPSKWSSCSNADFKSWWRNAGHACVKPIWILETVLYDWIGIGWLLNYMQN